MAVARLKRRSEFLRVAAARRKWAAPGLVLQAAPAAGVRPAAASEAELEFRVGFTVSRKVGNAVARNRAKRRLRAAVEQMLPLHAAAATDYVVIGRQETVTRPFALLLKDLETALKRVAGRRDGQGSTSKGESR